MQYSLYSLVNERENRFFAWNCSQQCLKQPGHEYYCFFEPATRTSRVPSSSILIKRRQRSLWLISSKLCSSHPPRNSRRMNSTTGGKKKTYFGGEVSLKGPSLCRVTEEFNNVVAHRNAFIKFAPVLLGTLISVHVFLFFFILYICDVKRDPTACAHANA